MPGFASLYEINTRIWLGEIGRRLRRAATLDQVADAELDRLAELGFDWVWLLGVWSTGEAGRRASLDFVHRHPEFRDDLPDLSDEDVRGSPYAIRRYEVHPDFGGLGALLRLRRRMKERGLRLMLDFVPNHTALDHPWVESHPEFYVHGAEADLAREPENYRRIETPSGPIILAHGRDPYFPGWTDTLQLNYRLPALKRAMTAGLTAVAGLCDGVRCDMAMLVLPDIFLRTWGDRALPADGTPPDDSPFWPAAIAAARRANPGFLMMAEAYWDLEWVLQQQGFDLTYDKRLYDRLHDRDADAVRAHLRADLTFQSRAARFLENHDEPRAAAAFPDDVHRAAALVTYLTPGLRFFHEGQLDGRRLRASVHLARRPDEPGDPALRDFYDRLLACLRRPEFREGRWRLLDARPAWDGNPTFNSFLTFLWDHEGRTDLVVVNYGPAQGQCYVPLPPIEASGRLLRLVDRMGPSSYDRNADDLSTKGLYLDMPPWGCHVFAIDPPRPDSDVS